MDRLGYRRYVAQGGDVGAAVTDSYYKISRAFVDGEPEGNLTRETILDNITLYWLKGTGASAARWYWEFGRTVPGHGPGRRPGSTAGLGSGRLHDVSRRDLGRPRSWVETVYPHPAYFSQVDKGGHFAAWEEPELFTTEMRAAFATL